MSCRALRKKNHRAASRSQNRERVLRSSRPTSSLSRNNRHGPTTWLKLLLLSRSQTFYNNKKLIGFTGFILVGLLSELAQVREDHNSEYCNPLNLEFRRHVQECSYHSYLGISPYVKGGKYKIK